MFLEHSRIRLHAFGTTIALGKVNGHGVKIGQWPRDNFLNFGVFVGWYKMTGKFEISALRHPLNIKHKQLPTKSKKVNDLGWRRMTWVNPWSTNASDLAGTDREDHYQLIPWSKIPVFASYISLETLQDHISRWHDLIDDFIGQRSFEVGSPNFHTMHTGTKF